MLKTLHRTLTSRPFFLAIGLAAVLLVAALAWLQLALPLNDRLPVPSPDGRYFAYFDLSKSASNGSEGEYDLIVATPDGGMAARFPMRPGTIFWSSAGHLSVVNESRTQATLISNAQGRFLPLATLVLSRGSEVRWSRDGTKLAYLRPAAGPPTPGGLRTAGGSEIAIYDFPQTQALAVPLPGDFRLQEAMLLFWSRSSEELFFLNAEGPEVVLEKLDTLSGEVQSIAKGNKVWFTPVVDRPEISPEGTKIYLPSPLASVIDARSGETLWVPPPGGRSLWSPWSSDGRRMFYSQNGRRGQILAHDFSDASDRVILSGVQTNGFFTPDSRNYFYRAPRTGTGAYLTLGLGDWLRRRWDGQQVDVVTQSAQPLGREGLFPGAPPTQDGKILMARDTYTRMLYGLYDPNARIFSPYTFPTDSEDVFRGIQSHGVIFLIVALYGLLGFFVYLQRSGSPPARGLYLLSIVLMVLFASAGVIPSIVSMRRVVPFPVTALSTYFDWRLRWVISGDFVMEVSMLVFVLVLALVPPTLLHFAIFFPEGNQFLARRKGLWAPLYGAAFLPALGFLMGLTKYSVPEALKPIVISLVLMSGAIASAIALVALLHNYRHPPDRRAKDQVRWVALAFAVPPNGLAALMLGFLLFEWVRSSMGLGQLKVWDTLFMTTALALLCLFTPLAIGYALVAHKLFDIQLLLRRTLRYSLMTFLVLVVYGLLAGGLSWAIAGSLRAPSEFVVIASTLVTAAILAPARRRVEHFIDRTFDRTKYDFREALLSFANSLPNILDRQALAARMRETVLNAMKCLTFYLFVLDRRTRKLRPQLAPVPQNGTGPAQGNAASGDIAGVEFDPGEPLCRFLIEVGRPFEAEVSPYDPRLLAVFTTAGERLEKLEAAVVFALERRGELVGLMMVGTKASEEFYNAEDLHLLKTVARQAAVAIENTELFEEVAQDRELRKELEVAAEVQAHLFPSNVPETRGCQVAGRCLPARSVSGDYYDFLELPGSKIGLAIGDVSGKGVSASLLMANLQGLLRTQAMTTENPADLARRINKQLYGSSRGAKYCTFFYIVYDQVERRFEYVNAGHNPPLVLEGAKTRFLESTGLPLGLFPEVQHETRTESLSPGARLVLYSDGITEARNAQGEYYGVDRLVKVVARDKSQDATVLVERILNDVREFCGEEPSEDDQTLVLLTVNAA